MLVLGHRGDLEKAINLLEQDTLRMGALVEDSCLLAFNSIFRRDLASAKKIKLQDKQIDIFYKQIELACIDLIARQSPIERDLRLLSAFMQLVRDLERIGDYAQNLAEIGIKLFPHPTPPYLDRLELMFNRCRAMLALSLGALAGLDGQLGSQIKIKDDVVDQDYRTLYDLLAHHAPPTGSPEPLLLMVLAIHHLERVGDHATNIGQRVAYIATGKR
ncbi:MAG: phosphate signaling complex protein PhoU [Pseudanabaenaceae cyanobacterium]